MSTDANKLDILEQVITVYKNSINHFADPEYLRALGDVLNMIKHLKEFKRNIKFDNVILQILSETFSKQSEE